MTQLPPLNTGPVTAPPPGGKLVVVSLAMGVVVSVLMFLWIVRIKQQATVEAITVWTLTRSVRPGDQVRVRDLESVPIPRKFEKAMASIGAIVDQDAVDLRLTEKREFKRSAGQGQLLTYDLFDESTIVTPPDIRDGHREVALPVNSKVVTGTIRPGHFVDIYAPFDTGGEIAENLLVLENVKVMALGERSVEDASAQGGKRSYHTITVQVMREVARDLGNVTRMIAPQQSYELHLKRPDDTKDLQNKPGEISERVKKLLQQKLPRSAVPRGS